MIEGHIWVGTVDWQMSAGVRIGLYSHLILCRNVILVSFLAHLYVSGLITITCFYLVAIRSPQCYNAICLTCVCSLSPTFIFYLVYLGKVLKKNKNPTTALFLHGMCWNSNYMS